MIALLLLLVAVLSVRFLPVLLQDHAALGRLCRCPESEQLKNLREDRVYRCFRLDIHRSRSKASDRGATAVEGVHDVENSDSLALCVLGVPHNIVEGCLEKILDSSANLSIDG